MSPTSEAGLKVHLEELTSVLRLARASFDIWWRFADRAFVIKNRDLVDGLSQFFFFNGEANFFSCVVRSCVLFDKSKGVLNLEDIGKEAGRIKLIEKNELDNFNSQIATAIPTAKKLQIIRNKAMAHKSKNLRFRDVYKAAKLSANEMREFTDHCLQAINYLRKALQMSEVKFSNDF